jgi:hypothetical protein
MRFLIVFTFLHLFDCKLLQSFKKIISTSIVISSCTLINPADAIEKLKNLDGNAIAKIVGEDISVRQALVTADFSRNIYSETCKFQDEIDIYPIDKYVSGTKALFNAPKSHVELDGPVVANLNTVTFPFKETLTFNLPFSPYVYLTGHVDLTRGEDGLIVYSREHWDQSVSQVLSQVKF